MPFQINMLDPHRWWRGGGGGGLHVRACVYVCVGTCTETCEHMCVCVCVCVSGYTSTIIYTHTAYVLM